MRSSEAGSRRDSHETPLEITLQQKGPEVRDGSQSKVLWSECAHFPKWVTAEFRLSESFSWCLNIPTCSGYHILGLYTVCFHSTWLPIAPHPFLWRAKLSASVSGFSRDTQWRRRSRCQSADAAISCAMRSNEGPLFLLESRYEQLLGSGESLRAMRTPVGL